METLENAVKKWLQHNRRFTKRTEEHYAAAIEKFVDGLPKNVRSVKKIAPEHLQSYINNTINRGLSNRTANANLTVLKSFCRWLSEQYDIPNAAQKIRMLKEDPPVPRVLSHEQYLKVLDFIDSETRDIIEFIGNTGLRASELVALDWDSVSEDGKRIIFVGKGRKQRCVPLNTTCQRILADLRQPDSDSRGPVFSKKVVYKSRVRFSAKTPEARAKQLANLKRSGKHQKAIQSNGRIDRRLLHKVCRNAAVSAGIQMFGPHALRHYFATRLLRLGVPIAYVSKILGHSSIRVTEQFYQHFLPDFLDGRTEILCKPEANPKTYRGAKS